MDLSPLTLALAFGAGVLSFASPCCVPLVPAYLGYMTGMSVDELREAELGGRLRVARLAVSFVLGLAAVFALLGASASAAGELLLSFRPLVLKLGGLLIILFGLHLIGLFRLPFLLSEKRAEFAGYGNGGPGGACIMGAAFAMGWPFVLVGLAMARWHGLLKAFKRYATLISPASGVILIGMGALVFSGRLT